MFELQRKEIGDSGKKRRLWGKRQVPWFTQGGGKSSTALGTSVALRSEKNFQEGGNLGGRNCQSIAGKEKGAKRDVKGEGGAGEGNGLNKGGKRLAKVLD